MKKKLFILLVAIALLVKGFKNHSNSNQEKAENSSFSTNVENPLVKITAVELKRNKLGNKKENFTKSMVTIIDDIRNEIQEKREKVAIIAKKNELLQEENEFMDNLFARYHIKNKNSDELLSKMIVPPTSLILAQASLESGWAESNLAQDANNLFGMKSFSKKDDRIEKGGLIYRKYPTIRDSVEDYIVNLSRHKSYSALRTAIKKGKNTFELVNNLADYCEDPKYGKVLLAMINDNNFIQYD